MEVLGLIEMMELEGETRGRGSIKRSRVINDHNHMSTHCKIKSALEKKREGEIESLLVGFPS